MCSTVSVDEVVSSDELARSIRRGALKMVHRAKASHIGGALSIADLLAVLYTDILRLRPQELEWSGRDRLVFSKGHCCTALYSALALRGFFPTHELETYGCDGVRLMAHVSHNVPGVEVSTGSLGHGLPIACGMALAGKNDAQPYRVFALLSDGECDEGSTWEAALFAPHHRLDNQVVIVDYNKIQSFGTVEAVLSLEPLADKWRAFGWAVQEIDGHNHEEIKSALSFVPEVPDRPTAIIAHTVKGKGVSFMENELAWHYKSPDDEQLAQALAELDASR